MVDVVENRYQPAQKESAENPSQQQHQQQDNSNNKAAKEVVVAKTTAQYSSSGTPWPSRATTYSWALFVLFRNVAVLILVCVGL